MFFLPIIEWGKKFPMLIVCLQEKNNEYDAKLAQSNIQYYGPSRIANTHLKKREKKKHFGIHHNISSQIMHIYQVCLKILT